MAPLRRWLRRATDPAGNAASWASAYQALWEKVYGPNILIPTCRAQQFWAHLGKVANMSDMRYKNPGLPDFSYLYVKK